MSIDIEKVTGQTFAEALALLSRFFGEEGFETPLEDIRASLQIMIGEPNNCVFVARQGGQAVGVATVSVSVGLEYGKSAELEDLYVLPGARKHGIASALIEAVCDWCRGQHVRAVLITVTSTGAAEHKLLGYYQRRGFENTGRVILQRSLR